MENEIFKELYKLAYVSKLNQLYQNKEINFEFPISIEELSFDVLLDYNKEHFNKNKYILLKNALEYIIYTNNQKYINIFNDNNKELNKLINDEVVFRANITNFAFKNIKNKLNNLYKDEEIINKNKELFNKTCNYYSVNSYGNICRKIILDFISKFNNNEEIILDNILLTKKYDEKLINYSEEFLNKNNINEFKNFISRIILFDNYLHIKSMEIYNEDDDLNIYDDIVDFDDEYDEIPLMNKEILNYIDECLELNSLSLPEDTELRLNMYIYFITYNTYIDDKNFDLENIKDDNTNIKILKKINPLYLIDFINFDNK